MDGGRGAARRRRRRYPPKVSTYLEKCYAEGGRADNLQITYKPFHSHTGFSYAVDFTRMKQINKSTGYQRRIERRANPHFAGAAPAVIATVVSAEVVRGDAAAARTAPVARADFTGCPPPPEKFFTFEVKTVPLNTFERDTTGCDLNRAHQTNGGTLLTWAAEMHRADLCRSLLDRGADPSVKDWTTGHDALQWAEGSSGVDEKPPRDRAATVALLKARR